MILFVPFHQLCLVRFASFLGQAQLSAAIIANNSEEIHQANGCAIFESPAHT
jgi:hypothetical protein